MGHMCSRPSPESSTLKIRNDFCPPSDSTLGFDRTDLRCFELSLPQECIQTSSSYLAQEPFQGTLDCYLVVRAIPVQLSVAASSVLLWRDACHQVDGALLLDVVVGQGPTIFQLFSGKDQSLLIRADALLVADQIFETLY
jgi:hypothetical protein